VSYKVSKIKEQKINKKIEREREILVTFYCENEKKVVTSHEI
jgi:hypothetical protein